MADFGGSVYSANLDGSNRRTLLDAGGNLTGIAYAGGAPDIERHRRARHGRPHRKAITVQARLSRVTILNP